MRKGLSPAIIWVALPFLWRCGGAEISALLSPGSTDEHDARKRRTRNAWKIFISVDFGCSKIIKNCELLSIGRDADPKSPKGDLIFGHNYL
jgi:hypothetical protein